MYNLSYVTIMPMKFKLTAPFTTSGDQPQAISQLCWGIEQGIKEQVLLGVTGSGKTYTLANVIARTQLPTLVISHNKTLAAQLYQEFQSFFPQNAISYFVSYYDYFQPEAYIPQTDTYIEKETDINEEIDKLRLAATTNILTRPDTIVVASVSSIYNIGSPKEYGGFVLELRTGVVVNRNSILKRLVELQYDRSDFGFHRGTFRVRGSSIDIFPAYADYAMRIELDEREIIKLAKIDPVSGKLLENLTYLTLYPAKHFMTDTKNAEALRQIEADLSDRVAYFKKHNKFVEAQRLSQKVNFDVEMIKTVGYVNGIENYSRYFDGRRSGDPPFTLLDYFKEKYADNWLLCIDESHMTIPQIRGMYHGDRTRKQTLIDFGFRLPAALDNRPLTFSEFLRRLPSAIYLSATPSDWEQSRAKEATGKYQMGVDFTQNQSLHPSGAVEQLIRPTGLMDPQISVRPVTNQIDDLMREIEKRVKRKERVLVTTLTKRMAEDLAEYLSERGIKVNYLHSDVQTLERTDILDKLRRGNYDVIVGINLLREGLDLPEVSLVAILDADKEGFLRSDVSLIQTMGRAARHIHGEVIMYADTVTGSMKRAISEVERRRQIQLQYNKQNHIIPRSIEKPFRDKLVKETEILDPIYGKPSLGVDTQKYLDIDADALTPQDKRRLIKQLEKEMRKQASELNFELAAQIRDRILQLKMV